MNGVRCCRPRPRFARLTQNEDEFPKMATSFSNDAADSKNRIAPRYGFEARIRIHVERDKQKLTLMGWTRDISESGLSAFVAQGLSLGEVVTFEVPLPGCDKEVIPGKVARTLGTEYGFQFTALSAEQRARIQAMVKGQTAIPYSGRGR